MNTLLQAALKSYQRPELTSDELLAYASDYFGPQYVSQLEPVLGSHDLRIKGTGWRLRACHPYHQPAPSFMVRHEADLVNIWSSTLVIDLRGLGGVIESLMTHPHFPALIP